MTVTSQSTDTAATDPTAAGDVVRPENITGLTGTRAKVATGLLAMGLLAGGGYALTQTGSSGTTAGGADTAAGSPGAQGGGQGRGPGGAPVSGSISAISTTSISVKTATGSISTYRIASGATVVNNGAASTAGKLTVGEKVVVFTGPGPGAATTGSTDTANRIMGGSSATLGPAAGTGPAGGAGSVATGSA